VQLIAKKPVSNAYPKVIMTLGDHIRKRRLDSKLTQKQVARIIHVDEMTIVNWELSLTEPHPKNIPAVIDFLGYVPDNLVATESLGDKIRKYRMLHGLSRKKLAKVLGIDEAALTRLETGKGKLFPKTLRKISGSGLF
jgi:transcriptional regulator with XRE-family HTH domain